MGASPQRRYGASNAHQVAIVDYAPEPAPAVRGLMNDIADRLMGRRGGAYPPGPGTPEASFTGYQPAAPASMVRALSNGAGRGQIYPDTALHTMSSGLSDQPSASVVRAMFAERMRRRNGVT